MHFLIVSFCFCFFFSFCSILLNEYRSNLEFFFLINFEKMLILLEMKQKRIKSGFHVLVNVAVKMKQFYWDTVKSFQYFENSIVSDPFWKSIKKIIFLHSLIPGDIYDNIIHNIFFFQIITISLFFSFLWKILGRVRPKQFLLRMNDETFCSRMFGLCVHTNCMLSYHT